MRNRRTGTGFATACIPADGPIYIVCRIHPFKPACPLKSRSSPSSPGMPLARKGLENLKQAQKRLDQQLPEYSHQETPRFLRKSFTRLYV
ncbi:hypothetical protein HMPREF1326_02005 [Akkermansia sp. KLE1605]|nr:hypothetical protein HMPREF1326_02005 [Akkermansia sp. KLE1605]